LPSLLHSSPTRRSSDLFTFQLGVPDEPLMLDADPERIEQVLTNLVQNAVKYSGDSRQVDIGLTVEAGEAVTVVRDRGVGIPAGEDRKSTRLNSSHVAIS